MPRRGKKTEKNPEIFAGSRWIEAATAERIAAADPPDALAGPAQRAVLLDGKDEILATARLEPAHRRQQGTEGRLVQPYQQD
jgi:hypothetical protein